MRHASLLIKFTQQSSRSFCTSLRRLSNVKCLSSSVPDVETSSDNVTEYITKDFGKWSEKVAVQCSVTEKKYTFDDLRIKSTNLSKSLRKALGLRTGDIVALLLPNSPQFVVSALGILLSGLRLTTINPIYTADEIRKQIVDSDAKAIITFNSLLNKVRKALENGNLNVPIVLATATQAESVPRGTIKYEELVDVNVDYSSTDRLHHGDFVFLPYSSGTTGLPKGVMLSNDNLNVNLAQYLAMGVIEEATTNTQDILPGVLPFYHIYGFSMSMAALLQRGGKIVTLPEFSPNLFLRVLREQKPTILNTVPPLVLFLNAHPDVKSEDFESIRSLMSGAAPLGKLDEDNLRKKANKPINVLQAYGMTEMAPLVTIARLSRQEQYPGSIGELVPNTMAKVVHLDDPQDRHLGPNRTGELLVKGPQRMLGYYKKPNETKTSITEDGWYRTGDLVRCDERGMFYVEDRIKELIKVKGFQVAPAELEEVIRSFPEVAEAAVIGIDDKYSGELPRAYVVPKHGFKVDAEKLRSFVDQKVAAYKRLAGGVAVVPEIPKTASGKILRKQIKMEYKSSTIKSVG